MKRMLCALAGFTLMAGLWTGCEKKNKQSNPGGGSLTEQSASIQGIVTEKGTENLMTDVTIALLPTGQQVQTGEDGTYIMENLAVGTYTLKAQKEGYWAYEEEGFQLTEGQTMTLDMELMTVAADFTETAFGMNLEMVYVEGGTFRMGGTEAAYDDEKPVHEVTLNGFHIGKYEVTQAQWKNVMGSTLEDQRALSDYDNGIAGAGSDCPMYYVSWNDAQAFCKKLSEKTGKTYVLPTEAQWEYAARGRNKSNQTKYVGSDDMDEVAWYYKNSAGQTHSVGSKKANALGIYDMSGNVWEWCSDWYGNYSSSPEVNPHGAAEGANRVTRGGSWYYDAVRCRVSYRSGSSPAYRRNDIGFRVVCIP